MPVVSKWGDGGRRLNRPPVPAEPGQPAAVPVAAPPAKPPRPFRWETRVITATCGRTRTEAAKVFGPLAIHRSSELPGKLVLVHLALGEALTRMTLEPCLRRVAETVLGEIGPLLIEGNHNRINLESPAWIKPWLQELWNRDGWVDPAPFKNGTWQPAPAPEQPQP